MTANDSAWESERKDLSALYQDDRAARLAWAIGYAEQHREQALKIKEHLTDWLTLLDHVHDRPDLHEPALNLIGLLHLPVIRLGRFVEWAGYIRFAIAICARLGRVSEQAEYLERLSSILFWNGQFEAAQAAANESLAIARTVGDPRTLVIGAKAVIGSLLAHARPSAARDLLESIKADPLVQTAAGPKQAWIMAQLCVHDALILRATGGPRALIEAARLSDEAMGWLSRFPEADPNLYAHVCRTQGIHHWQIDEYKHAIKLLRQAVRLFNQQHDYFDQRLAEGTLGLVYWSSGYLLKAEQHMRRSARMAKRLNERWLFTRQIGNLALVALFRGRLLEARRYAERHCRLAESLGVQTEYSRARCNRGIIAFHQGEYNAALNDMDFDRCYLEQNYPGSAGLAPTYVNLARCYAVLGNLSEARANVEKAMRIADMTGLASLRVIALRALAECFPADDRQSPIGPLQEALALAKGIGRQIGAAGCLFSLAQLTGDVQMWEAGEALLVQMGATAWLRNSGQAWTIEQSVRLPTVT